MIKKTLVAISTILSLVCWYLFYEVYWKWDFNSNGKAFDSVDGVTYQDSSFIWGVFAAAFMIPLLVYLILSKSRTKG